VVHGTCERRVGRRVGLRCFSLSQISPEACCGWLRGGLRWLDLHTGKESVVDCCALLLEGWVAGFVPFTLAVFERRSSHRGYDPTPSGRWFAIVPSASSLKNSGILASMGFARTL